MSRPAPTTSIPASADEIPDVPVLQAIGDRRAIRDYDPDRKVEHGLDTSKYLS